MSAVLLMLILSAIEGSIASHHVDELSAKAPVLFVEAASLVETYQRAIKTDAIARAYKGDSACLAAFSFS